MHLNSLILLGDILPRNLFSSFFRELLAGIAATLYSVLGLFFEIVFAVANLDNTPMMQGIYSDIEQKFYVIVGIFMLFKVMMSLITYFANPDKIADKEIGAGKMVTRIIVMLALLIIVPNYVFKTLSDIQPKLVTTLGKVVLGSETALDQSQAHSAGQTIATTILGGFFTPSDAEGCGGTVIVGDGIFDSVMTMASAPCDNDKTAYKYNFNFTGAILSIVVILAFIIIIGIQVAIRAFKLMILKILAPVPIISYVDPKSMKDGGRTSAYMKLFISTYLDLFIHFGILYFVLVLMNKLVINYDIVDIFGIAGNALTILGDTKVFGFVFVIIGLLLFAFQAPKFIKKALGLKDSEFGAGLSGFLTTGAVMAGGLMTGGAAAMASKKAGGTFLKNMGAGIAAGVRSGVAGGKAGFAGGKADASKVFGAIGKSNADAAKLKAQGGSYLGSKAAYLQNLFGGEFEVDAMDRRIKATENIKKIQGDIKSRVESKAAEADWTRGSGSVTLGNQTYTVNGANLKKFEAAMKNVQERSVQTTDANGNVTTTTEKYMSWDGQEYRLDVAELLHEKIKKSNEKDYYHTEYLAFTGDQNAIARVGDLDGVMIEGFSNLDSKLRASGREDLVPGITVVADDFGDLKIQMGNADSAIGTLQRSDKYKDASRNKMSAK